MSNERENTEVPKAVNTETLTDTTANDSNHNISSNIIENKTNVTDSQTDLECDFNKVKIEEESSTDNVLNEDCHQDYHSCSDDEGLENNEVGEEKNGEIEGEETNEKDKIIDEEALKLTESKLSEEEKEERVQTSNQLKGEGNESFKAGKWEESVELYSGAIVACLLSQEDLRSILYSNRAAALIKLERRQQALEDLDKALQLNPTYIRARLRRADLNEQMERLEEALEDYKVLLEADPSLHVARAACVRLPEKINVKNEKMKQEVFGKLKELGNVVLKPFGLSTDMFKVQQDPATGSYSINMQK